MNDEHSHRVGGCPLPHHGVDWQDAGDAPVGEEGEVGHVGQPGQHAALQGHQGQDDLQHRLGVVAQDKVESPAWAKTFSSGVPDFLTIP